MASQGTERYWRTEFARSPSLPPELQAQSKENVGLSRRDVETAVAASVPSSCHRRAIATSTSPTPSCRPILGKRRGSVGSTSGSIYARPARVIGVVRIRAFRNEQDASFGVRS